MKVCLIYRSTKLKGHSIENVFDSISGRLGESVEVEKRYLPETGYSIMGFLKNLLFISKSKADVYHITGDAHYVSLVLPGKKTVLTVHDLRMLTKYKGLKKKLYEWIWVKIPVWKCAVVTAISESTKNEILDIFPQAANKIEVVPDPISEQFDFIPKVFNAECPKLLMIGTKENKNHIRMIEAIQGICCELFIIGRIPEEEKKKLEECNIRYKNFLNLTEDELIQKYIESDIVMFVSLYEGFGMPIIEGQVTGRIVITSNISPMKEVCGGGAVVVEPQDVMSIRKGVKRVIEDEGYRNELINEGFKNAEHYTSVEIGKKYRVIYERILLNNNIHDKE